MALIGNVSGSQDLEYQIGLTGTVIIGRPPIQSSTQHLPDISGAREDAVLFVSGAIGGIGSTSDTEGASKGVAYFGGDTIVSGVLVAVNNGVEGGTISGSIHETAEGISYLVAGANITIASGTNGQVTIASTGGGDVDVSGTPADNQVAIWTDADTLEGQATLTYDGTTFKFGDLTSGNKALPGTDVTFYVSGSALGEAASASEGIGSGGTTLIGGDLVVSGVIAGGTVQGENRELQFKSSKIGFTDNEASSYQYSAGTDTLFSVSGSVNALAGVLGDSNSRSEFVGDLVVSGALRVGQGRHADGVSSWNGGTISGSIHETEQGLSYLVAGSGISIASGTNGQVTITSSASSIAADDVSTGDAAVNIVTTSGNITLDAQANDADIIFKVDDDGAAVTALTLDGSDEGNAIFVNDLKLQSDSAAIHFGANDDIVLTHEADRGLILSQATETTGEPVFTIKNVGDLASGGGIEFILDNGAGEGDDDVLGFISFKGDDSGNSSTQFAKLEVLATDVTNNDEGGQFIFHVMADGTGGTAALKNVLSIGGEDVANSVVGGVVVNEDGINMDFRVESDNNTHAIFSDGSTDQVVIGAKSLPTLAADVGIFLSGTSHGMGTTSGDRAKGTTVVGGDLLVSGNAYFANSPAHQYGHDKAFNNIGTGVHFFVSGVLGGAMSNYGIATFGGDTFVSGAFVQVARGSHEFDDKATAVASMLTTVFFSSGSIDDYAMTPGRTRHAVFGGDLVVSGALKVGMGRGAQGLTYGSISGSIHETAGGLSYLVGGDNITIASASNGQVTISADSSVNLNGLTGATMADGDSIVFIDANDSNASRKETLSDFLDLVAGTVATTGLDRSGATLVVSDLHPVGVDGSANQLLTDDGDGTVTSESNLTFDGSVLTVAGNILPNADMSRDLGSTDKRWNNIYTGDLHLRNERGDWTIVEEPDYLCVINNLTGKKYKMDLTPLDEDE